MKNKATQKEQPQNKQAYDIPSQVQRSRILKELEKAGNGGRTTLQLREQLNIMRPGGRISELRENSYCINTIWTVTENAQGYKYRNARYVLKRGANHG